MICLFFLANGSHCKYLFSSCITLPSWNLSLLQMQTCNIKNSSTVKKTQMEKLNVKKCYLNIETLRKDRQMTCMWFYLFSFERSRCIMALSRCIMALYSNFNWLFILVIYLFSFRGRKNGFFDAKDEHWKSEGLFWRYW